METKVQVKADDTILRPWIVFDHCNGLQIQREDLEDRVLSSIQLQVWRRRIIFGVWIKFQVEKNKIYSDKDNI